MTTRDYGKAKVSGSVDELLDRIITIYAILSIHFVLVPTAPLPRRPQQSSSASWFSLNTPHSLQKIMEVQSANSMFQVSQVLGIGGRLLSSSLSPCKPAARPVAPNW